MISATSSGCSDRDSCGMGKISSSSSAFLPHAPHVARVPTSPSPEPRRILSSTFFQRNLLTMRKNIEQLNIQQETRRSLIDSAAAHRKRALELLKSRGVSRNLDELFFSTNSDSSNTRAAVPSSFSTSLNAEWLRNISEHIEAITETCNMPDVLLLPSQEIIASLGWGRCGSTSTVDDGEVGTEDSMGMHGSSSAVVSPVPMAARNSTYFEQEPQCGVRSRVPDSSVARELRRLVLTFQLDQEADKEEYGRACAAEASRCTRAQSPCVTNTSSSSNSVGEKRHQQSARLGPSDEFSEALNTGDWKKAGVYCGAGQFENADCESNKLPPISLDELEDAHSTASASPNTVGFYTYFFTTDVPPAFLRLQERQLLVTLLRMFSLCTGVLGCIFDYLEVIAPLVLRAVAEYNRERPESDLCAAGDAADVVTKIAPALSFFFKPEITATLAYHCLSALSAAHLVVHPPADGLLDAPECALEYLLDALEEAIIAIVSRSPAPTDIATAITEELGGEENVSSSRVLLSSLISRRAEVEREILPLMVTMRRRVQALVLAGEFAQRADSACKAALVIANVSSPTPKRLNEDLKETEGDDALPLFDTTPQLLPLLRRMLLLKRQVELTFFATGFRSLVVMLLANLVYNNRHIARALMATFDSDGTAPLQARVRRVDDIRSSPAQSLEDGIYISCAPEENSIFDLVVKASGRMDNENMGLAEWSEFFVRCACSCSSAARSCAAKIKENYAFSPPGAGQVLKRGGSGGAKIVTVSL